MKKLLVKTALVSLVAVAFSACGGGNTGGYDFSSIEDSTKGALAGSDYGTSVDTINIQRNGENLKFIWKKNTGGYSELAYNHSTKGRGWRLITANAKGTYTANCVKNSANDYEIVFSCDISNLYGAGSKYMHLKKGEEYKFYVNYGTDLTKGEVQKTITYLGNGEYTVE